MGDLIRKPLTWVIGAAVALIIGWWLISSLTGGKSAKVQAELNGNVAGAALESGKDAVGAVGAAAQRASDSDQLTQENRDAIQKAEGASVAVSPAADAAGIDALCRRTAYRDSARCRERVR